jgi:hypothetical protein
METVAKVAFILLRIAVGIASLASLAVTGLVILVIAFFNLAKGFLGAIGAAVVTFASAFQKSPDVPDPDPGIPLSLIGLAIFFVTMFASVFTPGQKIFLHLVAGMALIAGIWEIWRVTHEPQAQVLYLPVIGLWMIYYAVCLRR